MLYRYFLRGCAAVAALAGVVYTMALIFVAIDPVGVQMSTRVGTILLTVTVTCTLLAANGWQHLRSEDRIAAAVALAVIGVLEQRMVVVAERTAGNARNELVAAIREVADGVSTDLTDALGDKVETWLVRAHTSGMIAESVARPNGVTSIGRRGEV